jgi:hypothetical protein
LTIQEAILKCQKKKELFARPEAWGKTAQALDMGRHFSHRLIKITAIRAGAVWSSEWQVTPEDLLGKWEVVTLEALAQERTSRASKDNAETEGDTSIPG